MNALLDNLDTQVEETVEEHRFNRAAAAVATDLGGDDAAEAAAVEGLLREEARGVDDVLAKRGLLTGEDDEEDDKGEEEGGTVEEGDVGVDDDGVGVSGALEGGDAGAEVSAEQRQIAAKEELPSEDDANDKELVEGITEVWGNENVTGAEEPKSNEGEDGGKEKQGDTSGDGGEKKDTAQPSDTDAPSVKDTPASKEKKTEADTPAVTASKPKQPPTFSNLGSTAAPKSNNTPAIAPTTSAAHMKELRKLRRHVLQLNSDLEAAEREIDAQRQELERAGSRLERDRSRHKQEKEASEASHKAEVAALKTSHERALLTVKEANDLKLSEMEERVKRAEQQRAKEGGERDAELADALERERASVSSAAALVEEKNTMNERITALTSEVSRLETRLEHAAMQMELASERERDAEEQLDKALSLHARQLSVRQKREIELEQIVADLGAALVVAKGKVESAMRAGIDLDADGFRLGSLNSAEREGAEDDSEILKSKLQDSQDEIETLRAQLALERQRCSTLHDELQDLAKEQADELSGAHAKQRQYERKISDLTALVTTLQSRPNEEGIGGATSADKSYTRNLQHSGQYSGDEKKETDHLRKQITSLSEKIFDMQTKIDSSRSEISTMKNRLKSALLRAETAEKSLEAANQRLIMLDATTSGMSSADEEVGLGGIAKRRTGGFSSGATRRRRGGFPKASKVESIRSALGLHPGRFPTGGWQDMIASLLDTFDSLAVDLGSHFRRYPISRLAFLIYLGVLHIWGFFLLVYHAHAQDAGSGDHHGPEALFNSYRHMEQVPKIAAVMANDAANTMANQP